MRNGFSVSAERENRFWRDESGAVMVEVTVTILTFLLVLFGVLGGIIAFGLVGLFAGPVVLAVAWAVWREWAAHLCTEQASEP